MEQPTQKTSQPEQLMRKLVRSLTADQLYDLCEKLEVTDRGLYLWLNRAELIAYKKIRIMAEYFSQTQGREFSIPDLLNPADWYNVAPKPKRVMAKRN